MSTLYLTNTVLLAKRLLQILLKGNEDKISSGFLSLFKVIVLSHSTHYFLVRSHGQKDWKFHFKIYATTHNLLQDLHIHPLLKGISRLAGTHDLQSPSLLDEQSYELHMGRINT